MVKIVLIGVITFLLLQSRCTCDNPIVGPDTVTVHIIVTGSGKVSGCPEDTTVAAGDTLLLVAIPDSGSIFIGWDTPLFTTDNPLAVTVAGPVTIVARFAPRPKAMVLIHAKDSSFSMGSQDALGSVYEKPEHPVRFTYDYYIAATEVTIAQYRFVMAGVVPVTSADSAAGVLPVGNVSWYSAVLYCNALSKQQGYDTVYAYTAACPDSGLCSYTLENLAIHYDRFGYRLPTEAEWEYACRAGARAPYFWGDDGTKAPQFAWYFDNAESRAHGVGEKVPNAWGIYDMAGNVAEWTNDWLDSYPDTLQVDPAGPTYLTQEQFEASWERPLRGGSYRLSVSFLRSAVRRGVYSMPASGTQIDVGFRVAIGSLHAATTQPAVVHNDSLAIKIISNKSDLENSVGTHRIKVAFVQTDRRIRRLYLVDFSESPVQVVRCGNDTDVCAPTLSPDGQFVAYSSKDEGATGISRITIRSADTTGELRDTLSGFLPRWWVSPASADTFLIYCSAASHNDRPVWIHEVTYRQRIAGGKVVAAPQILWDTGSYHGGLSSSGRFLGTGYPRAKVVDLQLADRNIYPFVPPYNGQKIGDTVQICNFSMSPSRTDRGEALLIDFGYPQTSTLLGKSYGSHTVIFICNVNFFTEQSVTRWFEKPAGYDTWDFPEWTNHAGFIASVAQDVSDAVDDALYLIRVADSTYCKITEGKNLRDIGIWINPVDVTEEKDPDGYFGRYDMPSQTGGQPAMVKKLRLFWHERNRVKVVALGNSPTYYGFNPVAMSLPTLNSAWYQSDLGTSIHVAQQYVLPHTPQLRAIVLDLDASYLGVDSKMARPRYTGLYDSKGYEFDRDNTFYRDGIPTGVVQKIVAFSAATDWLGLDSSGGFTDSMLGEQQWGEPIIEGRDYSMRDSIVQVNIGLLRELADSTQAHAIELVVVNYPQNPRYATTAMVGRAGPNRSTYLELADTLKVIEQRYPNFHFYDANNLGDHDYEDRDAWDTNHLNRRGGMKIAARIDSLLQIYLQ